MATWVGAPRFPFDRYLEQTNALFAGFGLSADDAAIASRVLLAADARGIESHGLANMTYYASMYRSGECIPSAPLTVERESPVSLVLDAHHGPGHVQASRAMDRCIEKSIASGLCIATVRESTHFGVAGHYARMAVDAGLIGIAMTNSGALAAPTFGADPMLGTNPIAFGVPLGAHASPIVLDMSTSAVAWGKIGVARRANEAIPLGWGVDVDGRPTTDPHAVRALLPLGGDRSTSGHKGYGLGLMVDILCGPLGGAAWSSLIHGQRPSGEYIGTGHVFMAIRIDAFRDPDDFSRDVSAMLENLRGTRLAPDQPSDRVLIPGEPEAAQLRVNEIRGVPIRPEVLVEVERVCAEWDVPFLLT